MKRGFFVLLFVLIILLGLNLSAQAETGIIQLTANSYEDSCPQIKGNYVVWQGRADGDWDIFLYNLTTGTTTKVHPENDYGDVMPQTDGRYVVWLGFSSSGGEIFIYDIWTKTTTPITGDTNVDSPPQIANGFVVWTSHPVGTSVEPGQIILLDIENNERTTLSSYEWVDPNNSFDDSSPGINEEKVVWSQANGLSGATLYVFDLDIPVEVDVNPAPAQQGFIWDDSSQTYGNLAVYSRVIGSDREIFVRKIDANGDRTSEQITDNYIPDKYPRISGNNIVWVSGKGRAAEIFLVSYSYTFSGLASMLETLVEAGFIEPQMQTAFLSKIENSEASADRENICAAINQLEALLNQVTAQDGKKLLGGVDAIISYTNGVIDWLLTQLPEGKSCH